MKYLAQGHTAHKVAQLGLISVTPKLKLISLHGTASKESTQVRGDRKQE